MHFQFSVHKYPACMQAYFKRWCSALGALEASVCIAVCSGDSLECSKNSWKSAVLQQVKRAMTVFTSPVTGSRDPPTSHNTQSWTLRQAVIKLDPLNVISATSMIQPPASARCFPSAHQIIFGQISQKKKKNHPPNTHIQSDLQVSHITIQHRAEDEG